MQQPTIINAKALRFEVRGAGYVRGDDRPYDVWHRRLGLLGVVERDWLPPATPGAEPAPGWNFRSNDHRRIGQGRTRAAAVLAAYAAPEAP